MSAFLLLVLFFFTQTWQYTSAAVSAHSLSSSEPLRADGNSSTRSAVTDLYVWNVSSALKCSVRFDFSRVEADSDLLTLWSLHVKTWLYTIIPATNGSMNKSSWAIENNGTLYVILLKFLSCHFRTKFFNMGIQIRIRLHLHEHLPSQV